MDLFTQPTDLPDVIKMLQAKKLLPTNLTSEQLRQLSAQIRRMSLFSAQTTSVDLLEKYKQVINSILNPQQVQRAGETQTVTEGLNPTKAREVITDFLKSIGYQPGEGTRGTLLDLSSAPRINLVIKTNSELAWGAGSFVQQNTNPTRVQDFPALELYRLQAKKVPRDWQTRWNLAARESGDTDAAAALAIHGVMAALKSSDIWQALGDGAGGFEDTLGNPYPPFAFQSGMWTRDVERANAVKWGLIDTDEQAKPAAFNFASLFNLDNLKEAA